MNLHLLKGKRITDSREQWNNRIYWYEILVVLTCYSTERCHQVFLGLAVIHDQLDQESLVATLSLLYWCDISLT